MPRIEANGVELEYEDYGPPDAPPLLMVMGLGAQLTLWPIELVEALDAVEGLAFERSRGDAHARRGFIRSRREPRRRAECESARRAQHPSLRHVLQRKKGAAIAGGPGGRRRDQYSAAILTP